MWRAIDLPHFLALYRQTLSMALNQCKIERQALNRFTPEKRNFVMQGVSFILQL